ncbi:MAG: Short-chain dehydrogenase [Chloroflexi bacterium AL-W]|nr:Short-chain dehydrogenase [Chloroflexi bacterium AL-N1]NOK69961.1 Short-chain dehydrogenase [Chloroflexi bacterium AL-N10]NOK73741.1 Short-chain dehydrogenase [Chloroflexi bacterium AL-N5]NOK85493.1 Short-chain dehydrogenase [Chloroflexi bacterium AL-W]NOK91694.1 Short-chain dehydrogenase [Chloroflexi bacterium AL-N15]
MLDTPRTILITGATDGIGLALARQYQTPDTQQILVGRRPVDTLDPTLFTAASYCQTDLSQPESAATIERFLVERAVERLDLLVHNAGVGFYGATNDQSPASIRHLEAVNLRAPITLTHTLLPYLERARGTIVFISSVVSALPAPDYAVYTATKAALEGFARSLRIELDGKVHVQVIRPGATRTNMHERSGAPLDKLGWERFPTAEVVAQQIAGAIARGRPSATIGFTNQLLYTAGTHFDGVIDRFVQRRGR